MDEIKYMLKPDWVKADAIKKCLIKAHESNRAKGIVMHNQFMSVDEFENYLKDAYCFVAIKENQVIITCTDSFKINNSNSIFEF